MALNGCAVTIKLGANGVLGLNNVTVDPTRDQLDVTDFDSSCSREFINGLIGTTITLSGDYEPTDTTGQVAIMSALLTPATLTGGTKPAITFDGTNGFTGDANVASASIGSTVEGKATFTATLQITGAISILS